MSNTTVGQVYQQVMKDVIESSRVDFEEGGVDESVLEELRQGWQKKLSALKIAQFPWDPKPEPQPQQPMQNMNYSQDMNTPPNGMSQHNINLPNMNMPQMQQNSNGPRIKSEPGLEQNGMAGMPAQFSQPPVQAPTGLSAAERAAFNLQQRFGQGAANSIGVLQQQGQQQGPQQGQVQPKIEPGLQPQQQTLQQQMLQHQVAQPQMSMQQPPAPNGQQTQARPNMTQHQYSAMLAQQQAARMRAQSQNPQSQQPQQNFQAQPSQQNGVNQAQTDGAGDEPVAYLQLPSADGGYDLGRVEIDDLIRRRIESTGRTMEGGGLMLPLKEHKPDGSRKKRRIASGSGVESSIAQTDGVDSDDDADEDAINSDLDDPEDGLNDDDDDEDDKANVMLCMYDKVQRVKNKWKCVMKDGVITINGKEYVFHKASGEYEW